MYKSIIILCLSITMPLFAQAAKIGVVDVQKIAKSLPEFTNLEIKLKSEFKERQETLKKLENQIKEKLSKLQKDAATLGTNEKISLEREIEAKQTEYKLKGKAFQEDMMRRNQEVERTFISKIQKAIQDTAKSQKYDLILQKDSIPYSSEAMDISDKVIQHIKSGK